MPDKTIVIITLILWFILLYVGLIDMDNKAPFIAFLVSFFTFLIGREALERFELHEETLLFSNELTATAENIVLLALCFLAIGYFIPVPRVVNKSYKESYAVVDNSNDSRFFSEYYNAVRTISKYVFYLTFVFKFFDTLDAVRHVFINGYYSLYTTYTSSLPYIIVKLGDMSTIALWVFLSTMPSKKDVRLPIGIYVFSLVVSLGTGGRFNFVSGILTLFVYMLVRNKVNNAGEKWFGNKEIIFVVISAPILIVCLYLINIIRFGNEVGSFNIFDSIFEFFYSQGVSINVIKRSMYYADRLPANKIYTIGATITWLKGNLISRLFGITVYRGNTIDHAMYGYSLAHSLSYIVLGKRYLMGAGLGSCYLAEAFHDFGYIGVIITSFIYGVMLRRMFNFSRRGVWGTTISFLMLSALLHASKGTFDSFFTDILDMTTWGTILIIYLASMQLKKRRNLQRSHTVPNRVSDINKINE